MNELNSRPSYIRQDPRSDPEKTDRGDRLIAFAVCFQVSVVGIKNALVQGVPFLYEINSTLNIILFAIVGLLYVWAFLSNLNRIVLVNPAVLLFGLLILFSFAYTWAFFPNNKSVVIEWLPRIIPYYFLTAYLITKLSSTKWIVYYMTRFSYAIIFCCVISSVFIYSIGHVTTSQWQTYSMPMSYIAMLAVMWMLFKYNQRRSLLDLVFIIVGSANIVLFGARNPLIAILAYIVVRMLRTIFRKETSTSKKVFFAYLMLIMALMMFFYRDILDILDNLFQAINIQSRTLRLLKNTDLSTSGRTEIHVLIRYLLRQKPVTGLGVGGDVTITGYASHSLYLSILSSYGYVVGSLLLVWLLSSSAKAYLRAGPEDREVILLYICMTFPRGFTGGDFCSSDVLWWLLGLCVVVSQNWKRTVPMRS